ncbi:MAG: glycosyltransferase family 4 protein [Solirubrobacterales bacterium]
MKLAVISNMVDPNVTPVYERLAARDDCELLVLYETAVEPNRKWRVPDLSFDHVFLKSRTVDLRFIHPDAFLHLTWGTNKTLKDFNPDVVVGRGSGIWSSPANISAFLFRKRNRWRFVPWWESFARDRPTIVRRVADPWIRFFLSRSDAVLTCGKRAGAYLETLGIDSSQIVIAPHSIPAKAPAHLPAIGGESAEGRRRRRLLFVGQLIPRKGIDVLLDALSRVDDAELWIAGDGELEDVVAAAARGDSRIRYLGHLPTEEIMALYPQIDILVVPSRYEVWGLVVDEALAFGRPVVATDQVGAADDLIEAGVTGEIVPAGDAAALAAAINSVCGWTDERLRRCAEVGSSAIESRGVDAAVGAYFELVE